MEFILCGTVLRAYGHTKTLVLAGIYDSFLTTLGELKEGEKSRSFLCRQ